jgi:segregation and condensation protein B
MLNDDILKALLEGIVYVSPEPVTLDGIVKVLEGEDRERVKAKLDELVADYDHNTHGIQIRQVANGYKFSTKAEHHEVLRKYVKSLKPLVRLSKPALETLAVIAYRQPVTMPEIEEIRGVDSGGVIHTLLEKKLVVTSGRKSVVGRPILYRTSKDFLVHFGLKDVGELPSLKEFEEMARRALGSEFTLGEAENATGEGAPAPSTEDGAPAIGEACSVVEATPDVAPPLAEASAPSEGLESSELPTATGEEAGGLGAEEPLVAPEEPEPPAGAETTSVEDPAPSESPGEPLGTDLPAESGADSAPEASEATPASDPAAIPEEADPKP